LLVHPLPTSNTLRAAKRAQPGIGSKHNCQSKLAANDMEIRYDKTNMTTPIRMGAENRQKSTFQVPPV
jgi:hypothetical protein